MPLDKMPQRTYLRFIEEEATAKRARAQIRPGDWSILMSRKDHLDFDLIYTCVGQKVLFASVMRKPWHSRQ